MKALSLWQPYASLIACGLKRVETRSWATSYRGPVLIHAAQRWTRAERDALAKLRADWDSIRARLNVADIRLGAVVAVARVASCVEMTPEIVDLCERTAPLELAVGDWKPGRFAWALEDVRALPAPVPCGGARGLWEARRIAASDGAWIARDLPAPDYDRLRAIYDEVARG